MTPNLASFLYLLSSLCFIWALKGLSSPNSARRGNYTGMMGMLIATVTTLYMPNVLSLEWILGGIFIGGSIGTLIAWRLKMTALPQLMAAFHSLVGLAAVCVAASTLENPETFGIGAPHHIPFSNLLEMSVGSAIGAITFTGSVIAFSKLQGILSGKPLSFKGQHFLNAFLGVLLIVLIFLFATTESSSLFWALTGLSFLLGILLILPIGGADMPVVVSMLNSYSGWAACGIGFTLSNPLLIITGALVGASGAILSYIMCKAMNRSILNVILGGFGTSQNEEASLSGPKASHAHVKTGSPEDAAYLLENAQSVIIVPGYGMAVSQAQHALREMVDLLKNKNISIRFAIHPVAGRMPGHMNVLLAEANIPYEDVFELDEINRDFSTTDVAFVIGANDITNPAAKTNPASPIYGMPILDVEKAKTVLFLKRSMAPGYAGVDNELFERENTMMLFGDAKKMVEHIVKNIA
ncbi:MAG: NAD synthetase [Alphaproteobacteria bacterium 16-39-46]|nr:MAG: NAD synthetase [Alphaproteobacteria bacterium 16-39-46]OZA43132.1 MAG: NAD synthetase [Alphaproteobacteria bacterium 17-39-52]HQS84032.1 NAD(P)(+) transhydrogenase (Re/Si-specific) subunit beta [Alphaproteobacteria bacterium]HQS93625.1 NAD(P)(+) transhydrogenase (Re/Si-specific) subunit beta [Alphaproteobacteria bacterium]